MSLLSPLPMAAALTAPLVFNSCKQPAGAEVR
jgi:hypothetical protein